MDPFSLAGNAFSLGPQPNPDPFYPNGGYNGQQYHQPPSYSNFHQPMGHPPSQNFSSTRQNHELSFNQPMGSVIHDQQPSHPYSDPRQQQQQQQQGQSNPQSNGFHQYPQPNSSGYNQMYSNPSQYAPQPYQQPMGQNPGHIGTQSAPKPQYQHPMYSQPNPNGQYPGPAPNGTQSAPKPQYQHPMHSQPARNPSQQPQGPGYAFSSTLASMHAPHPPNPRKKALLIGINYFQTKYELKGCINDVKTIKQYIKQHGYIESPESMCVLTDDNRNAQPLRKNIIEACKWLVHDARPGDKLFFHYSGHGGTEEDKNGDEEDGYDETIMPLDFKKAGQIIDDVSPPKHTMYTTRYSTQWPDIGTA
eukprot:TRINITY_DN597_c0_g1_i2.p1 TRINITY_DN597_c0_g1~~TRINITY_DN597_c0_g1_i2.p1  ORF type:complete len:368 (+),score=57.83 TRINITY_DN597_c0_g1_i2:23-1105(+)